jgi:hypothetical protein
MIPGWLSTLALFAVALVVFTGFGLPLARAMAPRGVPPIALAPTLGWAGFNVLALPILSALGFSALASWALVVSAASLAAWVWMRQPKPADAGLPLWSIGLAVVIGLVPLMAILPKSAPDGLLLAPPLFDHVKIAIVDAILRSGLPVPNPFYGPGGRGLLAYYYLWHFSAALLARPYGAPGWTADAAMTGFTASASLLLVMGLARALGGRSLALVLAPLLCLPGSLRPALGWLAGSFGSNPFHPRHPAGFARRRPAGRAVRGRRAAFADGPARRSGDRPAALPHFRQADTRGVSGGAGCAGLLAGHAALRLSRFGPARGLRRRAAAAPGLAAGGTRACACPDIIGGRLSGHCVAPAQHHRKQ